MEASIYPKDSCENSFEDRSKTAVVISRHIILGAHLKRHSVSLISVRSHHSCTKRSSSHAATLFMLRTGLMGRWPPASPATRLPAHISSSARLPLGTSYHGVGVQRRRRAHSQISSGFDLLRSVPVGGRFLALQEK